MGFNTHAGSTSTGFTRIYVGFSSLLKSLAFLDDNCDSDLTMVMMMTMKCCV